jgi:hypothetical protein
LAQCQTAAGTGESTAERSPPLCHHRLLARRDPQAARRDGRTCNAGGTFEQATYTPVAEFFFPEDQARIINELFPQVLRDSQGEIDIRFRHFKTSAARWMAYKVLTLTDVPPA